MGKVKELLMEQSDREQDLLIAELDHENRLLRARNERLERELTQARNTTIDEVATKLEAEFKIPFAQDTVSSFAVFIREMKQ